MDKTYLYTLDNGKDPSNPGNWVGKGAVFDETKIDTAHGGFVPVGAEHLWAPTHFTAGGTHFLLVPDVADVTSPGVSTTSEIAIATSTSLSGNYSFQGTYAINGYASDPAMFREKPEYAPAYLNWLVYADGDGDNCGGISIAALNSGDNPTTVLATSPITFRDGGQAIKAELGGCTRAGKFTGSVDRPYLEGASLYRFDGSIAEGSTDPYYLIFAAKPSGGTHGASNEVIAYATASMPAGPYTYRGIIMDASSTEWTNQASIAKFGDKYVFAYHDGTSCQANDSRDCSNGPRRSSPTGVPPWSAPDRGRSSCRSGTPTVRSASRRGSTRSSSRRRAAAWTH